MKSVFLKRVRYFTSREKSIVQKSKQNFRMCTNARVRGRMCSMVISRILLPHKFGALTIMKKRISEKINATE